MQLNDDMMKAHRLQYVKDNPNLATKPRKVDAEWQKQLTSAWLYDWREQWGILRTVRNTVGIEEAFHQFYSRIE
jgi:ribosomal protein L15E